MRVTRLGSVVRPIAIILSVILSAPGISLAQDASSAMPDFYQEPGHFPNRDYVNQHPEEHIDPFTGLLQYHYVDIFIPGNGGLDLKVERSYTVPQDAANFGVNDALGMKTYSGVGWTMHFGRVLTHGLQVCYAGSTTTDPVLELPDGTRKLLVNAFDGGPFLDVITTDRWKGTCDGAGNMTVFSPDGVQYRMDYGVATQSPGTGTVERSLYVTQIKDRNNNTINISYQTQLVGNVVLINSVTTSDGRSLNFAYQGVGSVAVRLSTITSDANFTWTYGYTQIADNPYGGYYQLTSVTRPDGLQWRYVYNSKEPLGVAGSWALSQVTYPQGGTISYTYGYKNFDPASLNNTVVATKTANPGGTYTYTYAPGSVPGTKYDVTTVYAPEGTYTYQHFGFNAANNGTMWEVGALVQKTIGTIQTETYTWTSQAISTQPYNRGIGGLADNDTEAPLLQTRTIIRDGASYTTNYSIFDSHGNPASISETGSASRSNSLTYYSGDAQWIIHQVKDETRSAGSITRGFDGNGNMASESRYGVQTTYTRTTAGDVASITNARNFTTNFTNYFRGSPQTENRPESVVINRVVDAAGNTTSETDGAGNTRTYAYDGLNRLKSINLPLGADVSVSYTASSRTLTRGGFIEAVQYDGFGRPTSITRANVATAIHYDSAGRKSFQSYPGSSQGITYGYDTLGRVIAMQFDGGGTKNFSYGAYSMTATNELSKATTYAYRSYGDPDERYVMGITAPESSANITLSRNAADKITGISQGSLSRTFAYNTSYFLLSEANPETLTTMYGRDAVGNMTSKAVGSFGQITYSYDGLDRLTSITYPPGGSTSTPGVTFTYDGNNQQKTANSTVANRTNAYDQNGNLTSETVAIDGLTFVITYTYDTLDNLATISYPGTTGTVVTYSPDLLGRPQSAAPFVTSAAHYPSGNLSSVTYANGATSSFLENARQLLSSVVHTKGVALANFTYGYDNVGNVTSITNSVGTDGPNWSTITYDGIDRLTSLSGSSGNGSINYDGNGNITLYNFSGINRGYGYANNQLTSVCCGISRTYSYDAAGNVTGDGTNTFQYDGASNLRCVSCSTSPIAFSYDANNLRIKKAKNGDTKYSIYSKKGLLLSEYDPVGQTYNEYVYLDGKVIARHLVSNISPTSTLLTVSPSAVMTGVPVTFTATVSGLSPTGTISFVEDGTTLGTASLVNGVAVWPHSFATTGFHTVVASYGGDSDDQASGSNPATVNVGIGETTATFLTINSGSCSSNCSAYPPVGTPITLQATVTGTTTPTGTVSFSSGTTQIGQTTVTTLNGSTAQATYQTASLGAGTYSVLAQYQGDATHQSSHSSAFGLTIYKDVTSVNLSSSLSPSVLGQTVTFSAAVANGYEPTGTMTFKDGASTLGSPVPISASTANLITNALVTGGHSVSATYSGDAANQSSTSATVNQVVNLATSSTGCSISPVSLKNTKPLTVSVTVTGHTPTGSATVYVDGVAKITQSLVSAATSFNVKGLKVGARSVTASYNGDGNNSASSCTPVTVHVTFDPALIPLLMNPTN